MRQHAMPCHSALPLLLQGFTVQSVPTKPIEGQKTGTSGLRKKTKVFMSEHYLANWWVGGGRWCSHERPRTTWPTGGYTGDDRP